jgi:hypothetical protein
MFLSDFGSCTVRNLLVGRFDAARLFSATPPANPARAAPPATSGVFAFDAAFATFPPVLRTAVAGGFAFDASCETFSVVFSTGPFEL